MTRKRIRSGQEEMHFTFGFNFDILECAVCMMHLKLPIHQCINGHVACPLCRGKLNNICPFCSQELGKIRNVALERLIDSLQVMCKYSVHGCDHLMKFAEKHDHESSCKYFPVNCLVPGCDLYGPEIGYLHHFENSHDMQRMDFSYGQYYQIELELCGNDPSTSYYVLHGQERLFILHMEESALGYFCYITRFGSNLQDPADDFFYELDMIDTIHSSCPTAHHLKSCCQFSMESATVNNFIVLATGTTRVRVKFLIDWNQK